MKKEELEEILTKSLSMEEEGRKFYLEGAEKIKNSLGRKMLLRLADDELMHIKRIKDIYNNLSNKDLGDVEIETQHVTVFAEIFSRMKEQMKDALDELTEVGVDDEEIINVALELESHARFYYSEAAGKATDKKVKEFYEQLAREEKGHYELLQNTNKYLENPSLFFGMGYH